MKKQHRSWISLIVGWLAALIVLTACVNPMGSGGSGSSNLSSDATLSALSLSAGPPLGFSSSTTSYSVTVPYATSSVTVTPTTNSSSATVTVNGTSDSSGTASGSIALTAGQSNAISVVVTAQDGSTKDTYTVNVTRASITSADITYFAFLQSNNPSLPRDYVGTVNTSSNTVTVDVANGTSVSSLVPTIYISGASVTPASGTSESFSSAVSYTVTAADGTTTKSYSVTVTVLPLATVSGTVTLPAADATAETKSSTVTLILGSSGSSVTTTLTWVDTQHATYSFPAEVPSGTDTVTAWIDMDASATVNDGDYYGTSSSFSVAWNSSTVTENLSLQTVSTTVSGTLTVPSGSSVSGKTVKLAFVPVNGTTASSDFSRLITWSGGTSMSFSVSGVPPNSYWLLAWFDMDGSNTMTKNDLLGYYGGTSVFPPASANLTVSNSGSQTGINIDLNLYPDTTTETAQISGTISPPAGGSLANHQYYIVASPVPNLTIAALNTMYGAIATGTWSSSGGSYTLSNVIPGSYYLIAFTDANGDGKIDSGDYLGYVGGSGTSPPSAPNVTVASGQTVSGQNATLGTVQ